MSVKLLAPLMPGALVAFGQELERALSHIEEGDEMCDHMLDGATLEEIYKITRRMCKMDVDHAQALLQTYTVVVPRDHFDAMMKRAGASYQMEKRIADLEAENSRLKESEATTRARMTEIMDFLNK